MNQNQHESERNYQKAEQTAQMRYKTSQKRNSLNQWRNWKWKKFCTACGARLVVATALIVAR
ncbi:hypothetical protein ACLK1V_08735 [Escherichia coli]